MFSEIIEASTKGKIPTLVETSRYTYIVDILKSANTYLTLNYLYHPCGLDFLLTNSLRIHHKITHFLATKNCPIKTSNNISVKTESNTGFIIRPLFFTLAHKDHILQSCQIQSLWKTVGK